MQGSPPAPQPPGHHPTGPNEPVPRMTRWPIVVAILVVLAALGAGALVLVTRGGSDTALDTPSRDDFVVTQAAATQPVFQPIFEEGDAPFFPLKTQLVGFERDSGKAASDEAVRSGSFGETVEATCDQSRLITYLYENPEKGEAWVAAQQISFNQLASYIGSLDARVLAAPAVVINNSFNGFTGAPVPVETTLDAGTAVLIDANSDIRVRCYSGNPVQPRPAAYRPERCIKAPSLVRLEPGGATTQVGAPSTVQLSGQTATAGAQTWSAVVWGDTAAETGWTPTLNLSEGSCLPVLDDGNRCASPGTPVWDEASDIIQIGRLGGEARSVDTTMQTAAPISPVGGVDGSVVENGFLLIDFTRAAPSTGGSAWVQISSLQDGGCGMPTVCVNSEGPVKARAGGFDTRPTGVHSVTFTGHFAHWNAFSAEVIFADGSTGWISSFYTAVDDTRCIEVTDPGDPNDPADPDAPPLPPGTPYCLSNAGVNETSTGGELLAYVTSLEVEVFDTDEETGTSQVRFFPDGPLGWARTESLTPPGTCPPRQVCVELTQTWTPLPETGSPLPGTPGFVVADFYGMYLPHPEPHRGYGSISVGGQHGWYVAGPQLPIECEAPNPEIEPGLGMFCTTGPLFSPRPLPSDGRLPLEEPILVFGPTRSIEAYGQQWEEVSIEGATDPLWIAATAVKQDLSACAIKLDGEPAAPEPAAPEPTPTPEVAATPTPEPEPTSAAAVPVSTPAPVPTAVVQPTPTPTSDATPSPEPSCLDADSDGICNADDNCRDTANADQADDDNDGQGNSCDVCTDQDLDLHCSETDDTCPTDYDPSLTDTENDGIGDACDNCPFTTNPDQADSDGNGIGNRCDTQTDPVPTPTPGGESPPSVCPAGQHEDYPGTGRCYPACNLGVMTSGGFCCPGSPLNDAEIASLGCSPVCGRAQVARYDPFDPGCIPDARDPDGARYDAKYG